MIKQADWEAKEKRQMFVDKVGAFIIKAGSEKDPIMEKVYIIAKQIVDKAFEVYPDKVDEDEPANLDFK